MESFQLSYNISKTMHLYKYYSLQYTVKYVMRGNHLKLNFWSLVLSQLLLYLSN